MYVINGYHSHGKGVDEKTGREFKYDNVILNCFADKWKDKIGLDDYGYLRFGQPTKELKIPSSVLIDCLGIPFSLGDDSADVLRKYNFEKHIVGAEVLPVYDEKGKVVSISFSFVDNDAVPVPAESPEAAEDDKDKKPKGK